MTIHQPQDGLVHQCLIKGMIETTQCPTAGELSTQFDRPLSEIQCSLQRLEANHGLVLHPDRCSVWTVHPFSVSPSGTWVSQDNRGWWAPCMWCAMGVAVLVHGNVTIHARIGGEADAVVFSVRDGYPESVEIYAHFALPPRNAWNNVHHFCAMLLPFRTQQGIDEWSNRHKFPRGEGVPIAQTAALARAWYGNHAESNYQKWTPVEAQGIFSEVGLTGAFWELDSVAWRF